MSEYLKTRYHNGHGEPLGAAGLFREKGEGAEVYYPQIGYVIFYAQNEEVHAEGMSWQGKTGGEWLVIQCFGIEPEDKYDRLRQKQWGGNPEQTYFVLE